MMQCVLPKNILSVHLKINNYFVLSNFKNTFDEEDFLGLSCKIIGDILKNIANIFKLIL